MKKTKHISLISALLLVSLIAFSSSKGIIDSLKSKLTKNNLSLNEKSKLLYEISNTYFSENDYSLALEYSKNALATYQLVNDSIGKALTLELIGTVYSEINDYENALQHYLTALEIFQASNKNENAAATKANMVSLYLKMGNFKKSLEYLFQNKIFYLQDSVLYKPQLIENYFVLGITYGSMEKSDSALFYFNKCEEYYSQSKNEIQFAGLLNNIGAIYSKMNDNSKALEYYEKGLSVFEKINNEKGIGVSIANIAFINKKQKKYSRAIALYEKAIALFVSTKSLHYLSEAYINLSDIFKESKNYEKALEYQEYYLQLKDSINNTEIMGRIANLEILHEVRKKEQELKILEQEKQLVEQESEIRRIRQWILASAFVLFLIIAVLVLRNQRISLKSNKLKKQLLENEKIILTNEKNILSDELGFKNKELEHFALRIVEKNDLLQKLNEQLKSPDALKEIKNISNSINHNLFLDKDRKELELQIDIAHQNFLHKLTNKFPDLSKTEKRLCSLLILDISSKDIATIMNISPDSVKKNRYRLRKKLDILSDEHISDYLKKI